MGCGLGLKMVGGMGSSGGLFSLKEGLGFVRSGGLSFDITTCT